MKLLVTGGAGFIGSAFIRLMLAACEDVRLVNLDKLTYAGNLDNLESIAADRRYRFVRGDICDADRVQSLFEDFQPDAVVHFAAESHIDRRMFFIQPVFETNLRGTFTLLEAARAFRVARFLHVSTGEVYGSLPEPAAAGETFPLRPGSPYSASKAGTDLLALSYFKTYRVPVIVTRASNNYGPYQFPDKFVPLMISNALDGLPLPVYGNGLHARDWLYVDDHCRALASLLRQGIEGEIYNIGGSCALPNLEVARRILAATGRDESLIEKVPDRPGHDLRHALDSGKIVRATGWAPQVSFAQGLSLTVAWYTQHRGWVDRVKSGEYRACCARNDSYRDAELVRL